jgi:hypothetical protein
MSINTNTIISVLIALILFYILIKVVASIVRVVVFVAIIAVVLFGIQSLGIYNIPVIDNIYPEVAKVIPYKQIWSNYDKYKNDVTNIQNSLK